MAEPGSFLGEVQRGLRRFWHTRWFIKWPIIVLAGLVLLAIAVPGSGDENGGDQAAASAGSTGEATPATASVPANTPKPTNTPKPAATPTPELTLEQKFARSYKDNKGFMVRAVGDPEVRWQPESGTLEFRKKAEALSEGDTLTITAHSALVANKAIWTTYPEVKLLQFTLVGEFSNQATGASSSQVAAAIMVDRATAEKWDYDGLKGVVLADNKRLFCNAPHYFIHLAIYRALKDPGCLGLPGKDPGPMLLE
jgi:hypothetical protein